MRARKTLLLAGLAAAGAAAAQEPPAGGIPELTGPRALALAATAGVAGGNDAILVNPAALGARRRYSVDALFFTDEREAGSAGRYFGGSVVDSMTGPLAAAFAYQRATEGTYTGNLYHLALAAPLTEGLYLGAAGTWFNVEGPRRASAATVDAGLFWQVARYLSVGAVGRNLVPIANEAIAPLGMAAGIAVGSDASLTVAAEWSAEFPEAGGTLSRWAGGVEYLLVRMVPLRAGYTFDEKLDTQWWSVGAGFVTRTVALDAAFRQSIDATSARTIVVALRMFPFQ
ncbi:MAG TPA: hypothetical protein VLS93_08395 [Anaeromyxobacteraceae bacterium]|nr:hypothetical protein [Anaeromyxobacteraceae bacterium]